MAWNILPQASPSQVPFGLPLVCILVPHFGSVTLEWVNSTYIPLCYVGQSDFAKTNKLSRGILSLDVHRNMLAKMALEDKSVTHLLWLDTDIVAENPADINQALRLLLQLNVPIVSGLYRAKKSKGDYPYAMWVRHPQVKEGFTDIQSWSGNWLKVDAIGFGFVLIKREVFEKIPEPWFEWKTQKSEDFEFCEKATQYGYEIKVYTDVKLSHIGTMKVRTDGAIHMLDV